MLIAAFISFAFGSILSWVTLRGRALAETARAERLAAAFDALILDRRREVHNRVMHASAAYRLGSGGPQTEDERRAVLRAPTVLVAAASCCHGDPVATHEALTCALVLHAKGQSDDVRIVDEYLKASIAGLEINKSYHDDAEVTGPQPRNVED